MSCVKDKKRAKEMRRRVMAHHLRVKWRTSHKLAHKQAYTHQHPMNMNNTQNIPDSGLIWECRPAIQSQAQSGGRPDPAWNPTPFHACFPTMMSARACVRVWVSVRTQYNLSDKPHTNTLYAKQSMPIRRNNTRMQQHTTSKQVTSGVFISAWASTQITPTSGRVFIIPANVPIPMLWSPPKVSTNRPCSVPPWTCPYMCTWTSSWESE